MHNGESSETGTAMTEHRVQAIQKTTNLYGLRDHRHNRLHRSTSVSLIIHSNSTTLHRISIMHNLAMCQTTCKLRLHTMAEVPQAVRTSLFQRLSNCA